MSEEVQMIHLYRSRFAAIRLLLLAAVSAGGLVASTSAPALAQASGTWALTGSMKIAREGQTATLLANGQVLVAGGTAGANTLASAELYTPATGKWSATGSMTTARAGQTATLLPNGQVLVAGGFNQTTAGSFTYLASAELYNPAAGTWTATGSMHTARLSETATLFPDGRVLVAGGAATVNGSFQVFASAELYDPATGTWIPTGSMNAPREQHTATLLPNGQVLAAGGYNDADPFNHSLASAELYNPATGTWALTGSMHTPRYGHQAVRLANGQVLVLYGTDVSSAGTFNLNSTELYNPATGTWVTTGSTFHFGNAPFSVTLLNTGKVLIAGGTTGVYPHTRIISAAELYDPATGTSASTGSMNAARNNQSATLLPDGQVLVAGGQSTASTGKFTDVASAELYTP
jgi:N-acetylneuraminic acid mutarotase